MVLCASMGLNQEITSIDFVGVCDINLHSVSWASSLNARELFLPVEYTPMWYRSFFQSRESKDSVLTVIVLDFCLFS